MDTRTVEAFKRDTANLLASMAMADDIETVGAMGKILADAVETARELYRGMRQYAPVQAPCKAERIERVRHQCPRCQREWTGSDLAAAGTVELKLCQLCTKAAATASAQPVMPEVTPEVSREAERIADGTYTVEFGDGTYRTIRIKTQEPDAQWMPGKCVASYLNGPDNWSNYQGFAFVNADNTFHVWAKHQGATAVISALAVLTSGKEAMVNGLKAYGMASGKCGVCGKKLTTPESIKLGIGPVCMANLGI